MERYVKTYNSKWQNQYTEEFKRSVCEEFLKGTDTLTSLERKYRLGNCRINHWLTEFGYKIKKHYILETTPMAPKPTNKPDSPESARVHELEKQLEMARLEAAAYRTMIEIAERELKIEIRKKSGTKQ